MTCSRDLVVTYVVSRWGEPTQTFVRREAEILASHGVTVDACSIKRPLVAGNVEARHSGPLAVLGANVWSLCRAPKTTLGIYLRVLRWCRLRNVVPQAIAAAHGVSWAMTRPSRPPNHLHAHFGWVAATAAWAWARLTGATYSVTLHAFELHQPRYDDRFARMPLAEADAVFVIAEQDRRLVRDRWHVEPELMRVGVPRSWLTPSAADDNSRRNEWEIVSVGSLVPKKGHEVLLRALSLADPRWTITIFGHGPQRRKLVRLVRSLGLEGRVTLAGQVPNERVRDALSRCAVVVLASLVTSTGDRDGIPVALMEAMARGAPVISTETSAIHELVADVGLLVPSADPRRLAEAIDSLRDEERRRALGEAGRDRVATQFVSEDWALRLLLRVNDLVGERR